MKPASIRVDPLANDIDDFDEQGCINKFRRFLKYPDKLREKDDTSDDTSSGNLNQKEKGRKAGLDDGRVDERRIGTSERMTRF